MLFVFHSRWKLSAVVVLTGVLLGGCHKHLSKNIPLASLQAKDRSADFADVFCGLLGNEPRPNGTTWGKCSVWLDGSKPRAVVVPKEVDATYRFLLIAGFGSDCLNGPNATFMDSIAHLQSAHSYKAETLPVSAFGSSEYNAKQIARYLNNQFVSDQRKYIVLGYSKGSDDLDVAIANEPGVADKVAALVTLSGVVQGSRLLSFSHPASAGKGSLGCTVGDGRGLESVSTKVRQAFLAAHPDPLVPTYSVAAYSTSGQTSRVLQPFWDDLSQYGKAEDSQMLAAEAVYPRGSYLGLLTRDHWAIAIPFEPSLLVDKGDFPRPQLFEAILRFVTADLKGTH